MIRTEYLTETAIVDFGKIRIDSGAACNKNFLDSRCRPDFVSHASRVVLEFDGYGHYTSAKTIIRDMEKDAIYTASGYSVIRIPYFVQFDAAVVDFLFKVFATDLSAYNSFSHGFHDPKAVLPADFCEIGVERFKSDLERFDIVAVDIIESLRKKSYEIGNPLCVVPRSMMHFL